MDHDDNVSFAGAGFAYHSPGLSNKWISSGLKQACPEGVFMSLTPGDPSLWSGVIFVRDGKLHRLGASTTMRCGTLMSSQYADTTVYWKPGA